MSDESQQSRFRCDEIDASRAKPRARIGVARLFATGVSVLLMGCGSPTQPNPGSVDYVVDVVGERFVVRLSDPETIRLANEQIRGGNTKFPLGPLRAGDGGFNQPWSWHLDPLETRLVDVAIELCDGRPSYVEQHRNEYPTYCPWGARIVSRR